MTLLTSLLFLFLVSKPFLPHITTSLKPFIPLSHPFSLPNNKNLTSDLCLVASMYEAKHSPPFG